jgi:phenylacetate-CoA ligase
MTFEYRRKRLQDVAAAVKSRKASKEREGWAPVQLRAFQQQRLDAIVRHAIEHSRFHRERYAGRVGAGPVDVAALPPVTKAELMERFDDVVTDPRLRRDALLAHAERATGDDLHLGRYRVITTSGSTGHKGIFVWDRPAWSELLAGFMRFTDWAGSSPRLPRRRRIAYLGPPSGMHMSRRMTTSMSIGVHRIAVVPVTTPMPQMVAALQRFQPDTLAGFPSVVALVAQEQIAGRLSIAPSVVTTASEVCTAEMRAALREAFGVPHFDSYAATETGYIAAECAQHQGMHVFGDHVLLEVVDANGDAVEPGRRGAQVLVTSFANRVQPTIRLAISDMTSIAPEPCPCGLPFPLLRGVDGRNDDVLQMPAGGGRSVAVHPVHFAPVAKASEVREFQVVQRGPELRVRVALHADAAPEQVERKLVEQMRQELQGLGLADPEVRVEFCPGIERDPAQMGKLKLVVADRG